MPSPQDPHARLWTLIRDARFGMLTHRHPDGSLHAIPLTTRNRALGPRDILYFFVSKATGVAQRLRQDGNVNLSCANPARDTWVSIAGEARISTDHDKVERLFDPMAKAWFPGGPTDPDLELLEVHIRQAESWDVKDSKAVQLMKMASAAMTGERATMGEHREVDIAGSRG